MCSFLPLIVFLINVGGGGMLMLLLAFLVVAGVFVVGFAAAADCV